MEISKLLILLFALVGSLQSLTVKQSDPLYLTPLIEKGDYITARNLAKVKHPYLNLKRITSYSGYLTVNSTYNSNLFFWFFPAKVNPSKAPVVSWSQGGPGAASLYGLFLENGPVFINSRNRMELREYSWHKNHNLLYIDNPVGAGYSFTDNQANGYLTNEVDIGNTLFEAVKQFYKLFPELRANGYYITGESYAGKYIPALAHAIRMKSNSSDPCDRIPLLGCAIGNGVSDPENQIGFGENMYQLGFIDTNALQTFNNVQNQAIAAIKQRNFLGALGLTFKLINTPGCLFNNLTGFTSPYNYLKPHGYEDGIAAVNKFMATSDIRKYLHVGNRNFTAFADVNIVLSHLLNDVMDTVAPWVVEMIENYKVFIYNGILDLLAGPTLAHNYLSKLQFSGADQYKVAPREFWKVDGELAGYVKKAGNLTEITVLLAGHMVPTDQPKWAYDMLLKLTSGKGF